MSTTVEERVARFGTELTFENRQFERNVETSLNTLQKLKQALNFKGYETSFDEVSKAADNFHLEKVSAGVDQLTRRFSTLGIVGATNIMDLTRAVRGRLLGAVNTVTSKIYEGGKRRAMNVEQARFLLQGLMDDSSQIEEIMKNAKDSVTDTAYGYDQAAMAAAQFATSGVKAGEQMSRTLAGVAGVAATTNSEYSSISEIFTQVAGKGRLMGDELLQLSSRGLNAAAIIAKYFNDVQNGSANATDSVRASIKELTQGLQVSEGEIREWTSKGKINFDIFSSAMSETFGKHAKDANKTLTGVLSNVNARFSQIGEKFFTPLIEQEGPLVRFFNVVKDKLGEVRDNIQPLANLVDGIIIRGLSELQERINNIPVVPFFEKFNQGVRTVTNALSPFSVITKDVWKSLGLTENQFSALGKTVRAVAREHGIAINEFISADGKFIDTLDRGWLTIDLFKEALDRVFGKEETEETVSNINEIREAALDVIRGDYGNGDERVAKLTEAGFDPEVVQAYVDKVREAAGGTWNFTDAMLDAIDAEMGSAEATAKLSDEQLKAKGYTDEQIQALRELAKVAEETGTPLNDLIAASNDPFKNVKLVVESAMNVLSNFGTVAKTAKEAFREVFPPILGTQITGFIAKIHAFSETLKLSDDNVGKLKRTFVGVFSAIQIWLDFVIARVKVFGPIVFRVASGLLDGILSVTAVIGDFVAEFAKASHESKLFEKAFSGIAFLLGGIVTAAGKAAKAIGGVGKSIADFISKHQLITKAVTGLSSILDTIITDVKAVQKSASFGVKFPGIDSLIKSFSALRKTLGDKFITPAIEKITSLFSGKAFKLPRMDSFVRGLGKVVDLLADKLGKGLSIVNDQLSKFDFDKAASSVSNFFDKLKTNWGIPIFDKLTEFFGAVSQHLPSIESLGSALQNAFGFISGNIIGPAFESITTFITSLVENGPSLESVTTAFKDLFDAVASNFKMPGFEGFLDIITKINDKIPDIDKATQKTASLADIASGNFDVPGFNKLKETFDKLKKQFVDSWIKKYENFVKSAKEYWNAPGLEKVRITFEKIKKIVKDLDPETVYMWAVRISNLLTGLAIRKAIKNLAKSFDGVAKAWEGVGKAFQGIAGSFQKIGDSVSRGITGVFDSLKGVVDTYKKKIKIATIANTLIKIAIAIGILTAAMWAISKIPEDKIKQIGILMGGLAIGLTAMFSIISLVGKFGDVKGAGTAMLAFAVSLVILGKAVETIANLSLTQDQLIEVAGAIAILMAVLAFCVRELNGVHVDPGVVAMPITFALGIGILASTMAGVGLIALKYKGAVERGFLAIAGSVTLMVGVLIAINRLAAFSIGAVLAPIAIALAIMQLALDIVALALIPDVLLERGKERLATLGVWMLMAMQVLRGMNVSVGAALAPLSLAAALLLLALDIVALGTVAMLPQFAIGAAAATVALFVLATAAGLMNRISGMGGSITNFAVPLALAGGILILTLAVIAIGVAAKSTDLWNALKIVGTVAAVLLASVYFFNQIQTNITSLISIAPLIAMTIAIGVLSLAIVGIGKIASHDDIVRGGEAMIAAAIALLIVGAAFEQLKLSPAMVAGPILFTLALVALMAVMWIVGQAPTWGTIGRGMAACLIAALSLALVARAFNNIKVDPGAIAILVLFILNVALLMEAIMQIGAMGKEKATVGIVAVVATLISLAIAIGVLAAVAPKLDLISASFIKLALGAVVLSVAVIGVAIGLMIMTEAIKSLANVNPEVILTTFLGLAITIAVIGAAAAVGAVPLLGFGAAMLMVGAGALLLAVAISILTGTFPAIIEGIKQVGESFKEAGANVMAGAVQGVLGGGASFITGIAGVAKSGYDAFCNFFGMHSPSTLMALAGLNIDLGAAQGVDAGAALPVGSMNNMSMDMLSAYAGNLFGEGGIGFLSAQLPVEAASGINSASGTATEGVTSLVNSLKDQYLSDMYNEDGTWKGATSQIPAEMGEGLLENTSQATDPMADLMSSLEGYGVDPSTIQGYFDSGALIPTTIGEGEDSTFSDLLSGNEDLLNQLKDGGMDFAGSSDVIGIGEEWDLSELAGLNNNSGEVTDTAEEIASDAADAAESTRGDWHDVGENLSHALARGIGAGRSDAINSAINVAVSAYNAAKSALQINSPSKLFVALGKGIDEGFILGMEKMQSNVSDTSENVAFGIVSAAKDPLDYLADLMSGDIIDDPTITPVLDLSEIQNGANRLYSMMSDVDRYSLNGNIALANDASLSINRDQRRRQESENQMMGTLIDAINGLSALIGNTGNVYNVNGVTYDDGSNVSSAVRSLIRAAKIEGRA